MRSRLEAEFAAWLDALQGGTRFPILVEWQYEPMCFGGLSGQYLPDFLLAFETSRGPHCVYAEVKPVVANFEAIAERMEIVWESEPAATLHLYELRAEGRVWSGRNDRWYDGRGARVRPH